MALTDIHTPSLQTASERAAPYAIFAGRVMLGSLFLLSGIDKAANYTATQGYMAASGVPGALLPLVIAFQFSVAAALIAGWHARLAAALLAGFSLTTAVVFHTDFADQIQTIMFLKNVAIAGGLLALAGAGAGAWAATRR